MLSNICSYFLISIKYKRHNIINVYCNWVSIEDVYEDTQWYYSVRTLDNKIIKKVQLGNSQLVLAFRRQSRESFTCITFVCDNVFFVVLFSLS